MLAYGIQTKARKQQKLVVTALCFLLNSLLPGCSAYSGVEFDPARPHHGDGEFVAMQKPSLSKYFFMRLRAEMRRRGLPSKQFQAIKIGETLVLD